MRGVPATGTAADGAADAEDPAPMTVPPLPRATATEEAAGAEPLLLFDCLAPFFREPGEGAINWSKIPFAGLEQDGVLDAAKVEPILAAFDAYVATMADLGYNAVAID